MLRLKASRCHTAVTTLVWKRGPAVSFCVPFCDLSSKSLGAVLAVPMSPSQSPHASHSREVQETMGVLFLETPSCKAATL